MPYWVDDEYIKTKYQIRRKYQNFLWTLAGFHAQFCKSKNIGHFESIADSLESLFKDCMEVDTLPDDYVIGNLLNNISAQMSRLLEAKQGNHNKGSFTKNYTELMRNRIDFHNGLADAYKYYRHNIGLTKINQSLASPIHGEFKMLEGLPTELQTKPRSGSEFESGSEPELESGSESELGSGLVVGKAIKELQDPLLVKKDPDEKQITMPGQYSKETMMDLLSDLRQIPLENMPTVKDKLVHVFFYHPLQMGFSFSFIAFAFGSAITTIMDFAQKKFMDQDDVFNQGFGGLTDVRVLVPIGFYTTGVALFFQKARKMFICTPAVTKMKKLSNEGSEDDLAIIPTSKENRNSVAL